jgi:hypothetical protein
MSYRLISFFKGLNVSFRTLFVFTLKKFYWIEYVISPASTDLTMKVKRNIKLILKSSVRVITTERVLFFYTTSLSYVDVGRQNIRRLTQIHKQNLVAFPPIFHEVFLAYIVKFKKLVSTNIFLCIQSTALSRAGCKRGDVNTYRKKLLVLPFVAIPLPKIETTMHIRNNKHL